MDSILSQSIVLPLLLLASSHASAHIPRLGVQRRASQNKPQQVSTRDGLATFYYKQPLDHFNYLPQSYNTFDQRYVIDFKHWQGVNPNAPIIVFFGAEEDIDNDISFIDFPIRFASRYKAMLVYLEHRFYEKSVPFGLIEKAMKNASIRGYLNSAQALAEVQENETSQTCYKSIRRSWAEIDRIAKNKPEGLMILSKRFKTCEKLNGSHELKNHLDNIFTYAAQYNSPHEKPVRGVCAAIDEVASKNSDVIEQVIAGVVALMGERDCYDVFEFGHPNNPINPFTWQAC
ncbi:Lysosomal Pro-X carboxypeptidase, partial [Cucurbita argyrosperma subsp. sororia]